VPAAKPQPTSETTLAAAIRRALRTEKDRAVRAWLRKLLAGSR
jgi:hypothetical protein